MLHKSRRPFYLFYLATIATLIAGVTGSSTRADERDEKAPAEPELLTVGSVAPPLDVEHWVNLGDGKFKPVTEFAEGHIYVVEFWATWCGPCIASMPHLAELQREFSDDDVQIISISDEPLKTVKTFLKRKVKATKSKKDPKGEKKGKEEGKEETKDAPSPKTYGELTSAYCLTTDPDRGSHDAYMKAAVQNGIPTSFIVGKTGDIEWVGHPMNLDEPLKEIIAGQWDREAFAKTFRQQQEFKLIVRNAMDLVDEDRYDDSLQMLIEAGNVADGRFKKSSELYINRVQLLKFTHMAENGKADDALAMINSEIKAVEAERTRLTRQRFEVFVAAGRHEQAAEELRSLAENLTSRSLNSIAWGIYESSEESDVPAVLLEAAIHAAEVAVEADPKNPSIVDTLAHLVHATGDLDGAIELQTKAASMLKAPHKGIEKYLAELEKEKQEQGKEEQGEEEKSNEEKSKEE